MYNLFASKKSDIHQDQKAYQPRDQKAYDPNDEEKDIERKAANLIPEIMYRGSENPINVPGIVVNLAKSMETNAEQLTGREKWLLYLLQEMMMNVTNFAMTAQYKPDMKRIETELPKGDKSYLGDGAGESRENAYLTSSTELQLLIAKISLLLKKATRLLHKNKEKHYISSAFYQKRDFLINKKKNESSS